jgi:hypothetical protein
MSEWNLEMLKRKYEKLREKYSLPSFQVLNEDFEIERLQERETETLTKEIRRAMIDKNLAYLKFAEMFMNPSTAPMFFLALVKSIDNKDKKLLEELYLELGKFEIKSIALDNNYDEKKDAEFIKSFHKEWQEIKKKFDKIMKAVEQAWEKEAEKKEKGYLG